MDKFEIISSGHGHEVVAAVNRLLSEQFANEPVNRLFSFETLTIDGLPYYTATVVKAECLPM